ncbi:MAG: amidase family protein, partial [bacterium]
FKLNTRNLDPQLMYLADIFTGLANLVGLPALSLPCGFDEEELPVAIHVMARPWDEEKLLALGHRLELELALPRDAVTPQV